MVVYFILLEDIFKDQLNFLRGDGAAPVQRKKVQAGEIGRQLMNSAPKNCITLSMLDGHPPAAEVTVRLNHVRKLPDDTADLLLTVSDCAKRWEFYSTPGVLSSARAIQMGSAVLYRKYKYANTKEQVGMVVSQGKVQGKQGTWFGVELLVSCRYRRHVCWIECRVHVQGTSKLCVL